MLLTKLTIARQLTFSALILLKREISPEKTSFNHLFEGLATRIEAPMQIKLAVAIHSGERLRPAVNHSQLQSAPQ